MPDARANRLVLWLSAASTVTAESLALESGADGLVVDHQHGGFGMDQALHLVQAVVSKTPLTVVRIAEVGDAETCKFLDAGASTLIAPMINSRAQAERFVQACYYPPSGVRSFGPYRQKLLVKGGFSLAAANKQVEPLAMIETRQAFERLDDILSVPGIAGVFVGPNDLVRRHAGMLVLTPRRRHARRRVCRASRSGMRRRPRQRAPCWT
jgi:4-hydroxy-2-oxoheptanedioate aldolase